MLRDRKTLFILFGMPVVQILIFGFALSSEVKNAQVMILDEAKDEYSQRIINRIAASSYFEVNQSITHQTQLVEGFKSGRVKLAVVFPANFGKMLMHQKKAQMQLIADGSDPNYATTITNYVRALVQDEQAAPYQIRAQVRMLYNPQLKGAPNFVPGVMALVLMLVCVMMTAVSIVKEKETGTMEILLVSPFSPLKVIVAKAVPYLLLSLVNVSTILLLSIFVLDVPVNGSILLLFAESTLFIVTCLSLGIFISIKTGSQQVAMLISLMGMLLPTIIFSGFMFPLENMPMPLQVISNIVPSKWYYIIVKSIMIKGLGFASIWRETLILLGITLVLLTVSLKSFKIRLQ